ncbi:Ribonuclease H2 subunit A, partial [Cucurbita argyrosperma subsp. sororia]
MSLRTSFDFLPIVEFLHMNLKDLFLFQYAIGSISEQMIYGRLYCGRFYSKGNAEEQREEPAMFLRSQSPKELRGLVEWMTVDEAGRVLVLGPVAYGYSDCCCSYVKALPSLNLADSKTLKE